MLTEAFKFLVGMGGKAEALKLVQVPGSRSFMFRKPDGSLDEVDGKPTTDLQPSTFDSFCSIAKGAKASRFFVDVELGGGLVMAGESEAPAFKVYGQNPRSERATALKAVEGVAMSPRTAVRTLLYTLGAPSVIVDALRRMEFKSEGRSTHATGHGADSMGREVDSAVLGAEKIPESFVYEFPLFDATPLTAELTACSVSIMLDIDTKGETVSCHVAPGHWARAKASALEGLRAHAEKVSGAPVHAGSIVVTEPKL